MLFSLGALMNVFKYREEGTSSLSAKSVLKIKSVRFLWKRSNSVKTVLKQNTRQTFYIEMIDFRTLIRVREMTTSINILNSNTFFLRVNLIQFCWPYIFNESSIENPFNTYFNDLYSITHKKVVTVCVPHRPLLILRISPLFMYLSPPPPRRIPL